MNKRERTAEAHAFVRHLRKKYPGVVFRATNVYGNEWLIGPRGIADREFHLWRCWTSYRPGQSADNARLITDFEAAAVRFCFTGRAE
jgi:hypothetical protein